MKIDREAFKRQMIMNLPYLLFLFLFAKVGQAVRLAPGADMSQKLLGMAEGFSLAFQSAWPGTLSDWLVGVCGMVIMRLAVYLKGCKKIPEERRVRERQMGNESRHCAIYG